MRQTSFSEAEFASKKKLTRRERFLAEIEAAIPWPALIAALLPYYPKGDGRGRPPIGLERILRMCIAPGALDQIASADFTLLQLVNFYHRL